MNTVQECCHLNVQRLKDHGATFASSVELRLLPSVCRGLTQKTTYHPDYWLS